jgi:hypothetical protein
MDGYETTAVGAAPEETAAAGVEEVAAATPGKQ